MDTATARLLANMRNMGADPTVDYHLRIADEIVKEGGIAIQNGLLTLPEAAGLGIILDEDTILQFTDRCIGI